MHSISCQSSISFRTIGPLFIYSTVRKSMEKTDVTRGSFFLFVCFFLFVFVCFLLFIELLAEHQVYCVGSSPTGPGRSALKKRMQALLHAPVHHRYTGSVRISSGRITLNLITFASALARILGPSGWSQFASRMYTVAELAASGSVNWPLHNAILDHTQVWAMVGMAPWGEWSWDRKFPPCTGQRMYNPFMSAGVKHKVRPASKLLCTLSCLLLMAACHSFMFQLVPLNGIQLQRVLEHIN